MNSCTCNVIGYDTKNRIPFSLKLNIIPTEMLFEIMPLDMIQITNVTFREI